MLSNGIRSTFRMEELTPRVNWRWAAGRFPNLVDEIERAQAHSRGAER